MMVVDPGVGTEQLFNTPTTLHLVRLSESGEDNHGLSFNS
jgi:hypothetical protein